MISLSDVRVARENVFQVVKATPILQSAQLSNRCGNRVFLKAEHLQKTGAFKIRGAANKVKQVVGKGATFVTAASSGNHGQAVAYIAKKLGIRATIVVPDDVIQNKLAAIQAYHGGIEKCGRTPSERLRRAEQLASEGGGAVIPPYDDPLIIAGQGTIGLELLDQLDEIDIVVVPIGGGGLISGILTAIKEIKPSVKVIGVEPETANDTCISLQNGAITSISQTATVADGLRATQPGNLKLPIVQHYVDDIVLVSEEQIKDAVRFVLERMKQLIEPSSAVTVAAAIYDKIGACEKNIVCVISGGNVDLSQLAKMMV
ncbi:MULTISPECIES: threonine/serine dehydratase [Clostridia]|uniref:threonine ammonia-lyase n=1 Tax=Clostridia TaxID=186801 RepID=UPI000EA14EFB|nr:MULTISPECIES: threonine/serine dehydratase [Clostridia]NBJ70998.1 threonine/serine dehydratase [Roseburia sp. 1XD42-34]RKI75435.1 threonine/serine dehydratase [Clostridium sp. 1xD42-85]